MDGEKRKERTRWREERRWRKDDDLVTPAPGSCCVLARSLAQSSSLLGPEILGVLEWVAAGLLALAPWLLLNLPLLGLARPRCQFSPTEMSWGTARFDWGGIIGRSPN